MSTSCSRETRSSEHGDGSLISRSPSSSSRASSAMSSSRQGSARSTQGSSGIRGSTRSTSRTASYTATRSASSSCNAKSKSVSLSHSLDEGTRQPGKFDRVPTPGVPRSVETRVATPFGFSNSHPVIPRRYVPSWQLDMKNRQLTIENCKKAEIDTWDGHTSHFLEKRERMAVTSHKPYTHILSDGRRLKSIHSHLSKYNSSMLYFN